MASERDLWTPAGKSPDMRAAARTHTLVADAFVISDQSQPTTPQPWPVRPPPSAWPSPATAAPGTVARPTPGTSKTPRDPAPARAGPVGVTDMMPMAMARPTCPCFDSKNSRTVLSATRTAFAHTNSTTHHTSTHRWHRHHRARVTLSCGYP